MNRLIDEAEWDRMDRRHVRTNLTEAFGEMGRRGLLCSRGWQRSRVRALDWLTTLALDSLGRGTPVLGYAFYTSAGMWKKERGKDFALHFGRFDHHLLHPVGLPGAEVGEVASGCLRRAGVGFRWDRSPDSPLRVIAASLARLP
jgi:hypothetical protein